MEKIKVNLLVKGDLLCIGGGSVCTENSNFWAFDNKPAPENLDLSEAAVIEGDLVIKGSYLLSKGVIAATGTVADLVPESYIESKAAQSCDPHFLKGDEQPADKGWHAANHGVVHGAMVPCGCPFLKAPDGTIRIKGGIATSNLERIFKND